MLGLTPRPDPEEGLDARQRGSLLHAILERLYRRLCAEETVPTPATQAQVLACLDACCTEIFQDAPQRYGFRPSPLWHHEQAEIRRQLAALLRWECQENGDRPGFHPFQQELAFGTAGGYPPAHIADGDGRAIRLRGIIDRIDRDEDGRLRIIDYKSGSTRYNGRDIEEGRAVQVALYALAAEQLFGEGVVVESIYLHIPTRELSGRLDFAQEKARSTLAAACRAVSQAAEAASAGHFPNLPSRPVGLVGTCADWCDLADLCQVPRHGRFQRAKVQ
ncbi:PD-(D/E)XK nuclease family protein [Litorilinea aerophila]|nr:PD-(D/E)XK nuclease family protein [Litorilinea aerophila]